MITQKIKILLSKDDVVLGNSISGLLELSNYEGSWFKNGIEAIFYLVKNATDLIISDLIMLNMNGEELFLNIRKNNEYHTIPFLMITANIDNDIKFKQLENGVNDFVRKPFKIKELVDKIKNHNDFKKNIEKKFSPDPFSKITIKLSEKNFLTFLNEMLLKNMKSKIDMNKLYNELYISKSNLSKRVMKLTNKNASQYIREFKLDYAVKLIQSGERNIQ